MPPDLRSCTAILRTPSRLTPAWCRDDWLRRMARRVAPPWRATGRARPAWTSRAAPAPRLARRRTRLRRVRRSICEGGRTDYDSLRISAGSSFAARRPVTRHASAAIDEEREWHARHRGEVRWADVEQDRRQRSATSETRPPHPRTTPTATRRRPGGRPSADMCEVRPRAPAGCRCRACAAGRNTPSRRRSRPQRARAPPRRKCPRAPSGSAARQSRRRRALHRSATLVSASSGSSSRMAFCSSGASVES